MMTMTGVLLVAMLMMMVVMCGGMIGGAVWTFTPRRVGVRTMQRRRQRAERQLAAAR